MQQGRRKAAMRALATITVETSCESWSGGGSSYLGVRRSSVSERGDVAAQLELFGDVTFQLVGPLGQLSLNRRAAARLGHRNQPQLRRATHLTGLPSFTHTHGLQLHFSY